MSTALLMVLQNRLRFVDECTIPKIKIENCEPNSFGQVIETRTPLEMTIYQLVEITHNIIAEANPSDYSIGLQPRMMGLVDA